MTNGEAYLLLVGFLEIPGEGQRDAIPPDVLPEGIHVGRCFAIGRGVLRVGVSPGRPQDEISDVLRHPKFVIRVGKEAVVSAGGSPVAGVGAARVVLMAYVRQELLSAVAQRDGGG